MLDAATRVDSASLGYPPYDIEKTGDDVYRLTMAVAGFSPDELDVTVQENVQLAYFAAKVRTLAAEAGMPNLD
jgi:molecular chaperone IbpA